MNPSLQFPVVSFATMLVAIVAFGVAQQDVALLLGAALPAAASWIFTEGPNRRGLPRWISTLLVLGVLAWTVMQAPLAADAVALARLVGEFVLWTSVIKLFERKSTRDRRQLLGLSLVLMLAGCLVSVDLLFAILLVLYAVLVIASLMLYRLARGVERMAERSRAVVGVVAPPPVYGGRAGRHLRRIVVAGLLIGTAVSLILFVLFPRDVLQRFDGWSNAASLAGFRGEVELRTGGPIESSRREIMTVQWLDPSGAPVQAAEPLRLRGAVLDRYEPGAARWVSTRMRGPVRAVSAGDDLHFEPLGSRPIDLRQQTWTQIVELRLLRTETVFSVWAPVAIAYPGVSIVMLNPATLELRDPDAERGPRVGGYQVKVQPFPSPGVLEALAGAPEPWRMPSFPIPGVGEEARRILGQVREPVPDRSELEGDPDRRWAWARQASSIFMRYLQGSGFRYSTDLSSLVLRRGEDPIEAFLRRGRSGHCELFASALAGMLLSVGVEARVVVGFVAVEYHAGSRRYIVRENNAHAWVEVRTGDFTWMTVDPTPAETLETLAGERRGWADSLRWFYDGIDFLWRTRVVAFDSRTQHSLLRRLGAWGADFVGELAGAVGEAVETLGRQFEAGGWGRIWSVSVIVTLAGMATTAILLSRRERRRRRLLRLDEVPPKERRRLRRDGAFFADALQMLERAGVPKPAWRPPLLHAAWLRERHQDGADAFQRLTALYYEIRFGGREPSRTDQTEAAALLRRLQVGLRGRPRR